MFYDQPEWSAGYRAHLQQMLGDLGATYIDASHWMPDEDAFADPLHLTYEGAQEFSRRLGEYLRNIAPPNRKANPRGRPKARIPEATRGARFRRT